MLEKEEADYEWGNVRMRSDYELEIRREDGTVQAIPMHATAYQATKAMTAGMRAQHERRPGGGALGMYSDGKGRVRHNAIKFGTIKKATEAA